MSKRIDRTEFLDKVRFELGSVRQINRSQIKTICEKYSLPFPTWLRKDPARQVARGVYALFEHSADNAVAITKSVVKAPVIAPVESAVTVAMVAPSVEIGRAHV